MRDVTTLLHAARAGEAEAANRLFEILYRDLRKIARAQLRRLDHAGRLDTTSLVHESYLRLRTNGVLKAEDRHHFLAYAANVMRSVVVDLARSALAEKHGGQQVFVTIRTGIQQASAEEDQDVIRIHEALEELAAIDPRLAKLVEMRYFAGMSEQEAADALGVARRTAQRDWEKARLFLAATLRPR